MATNVKIEHKGPLTIITVDRTQEHKASKSGKSIMVASSTGNIDIGDDGKGNRVKMGLNCYKSAESTESGEKK